MALSKLSYELLTRQKSESATSSRITTVVANPEEPQNEPLQIKWELLSSPPSSFCVTAFILCTLWEKRVKWQAAKVRQVSEDENLEAETSMLSSIAHDGSSDSETESTKSGLVCTYVKGDKMLLHSIIISWQVTPN